MSRKPTPAKADVRSDRQDDSTSATTFSVSPKKPVYDLFRKGDLPARKVGRKWLTTYTAVLRWVEHSSEQDTMARAIANGDREVLAAALKAGTVRVKKRG